VSPPAPRWAPTAEATTQARSSTAAGAPTAILIDKATYRATARSATAETISDKG
jgi:hypothetical protein